MSQPTPYTPNADFSQQEANNASGRSTVNTAALDAEFAAIETTLDQTLANIQLLQRDDGQLKDTIVSVMALDQSVINLMGGWTLKGAWMTVTNYAVNDIVSSGEYTYVCLTAHQSGIEFDSQYWSRFGFSGSADAAIAAGQSSASAASAATSATTATTKAASATASATAAATSSGNAADYAATATTKAGEAAASAANAANSAAKLPNLTAAGANKVVISNDLGSAWEYKTYQELVDEVDISARGAEQIGYFPAGAGAVATDVQSKLRESVSVKDFGAKGDGVTDDTAAINNWLAMLSMGIAIEAPEGRFKFTSALSIPALDNISIKGSGRQKTTFVYAGASTTNDIITIGDGITSFTGLSLEGFNIDSTTTMTAGTALRIKKQQNGGTNINGISFSVLNAPKKLWDGIWFDNTNVTTYKGFEINVQNEAIIVNGIAGADSGSDLYLDDGTITFASVGVHCAGGFGGLYLGQILFFGNLTHLKVDNGRVARFNREIILSDLSIFDGCKDYGVYVNDPLASGCNLTINAFIGSAGRIGSGGAGNNIAIISYPNSRITIGSGQIFNATQNGIWIGDATTIVNIGSATQITNNGAYGIYGNVSTNLVNYQCTFSANTLGDVQGNVRPTFQYTPVVLASSGTITSSTGVVNYHRVGNRVWFDAYLNITNNGTGSGVITCSLPTQIRQAACAAGYTNGVTYQGVFAQLPSNQTYMQITYESGAYPGATGQTIVVSGSYETY